MQNQTPDDKIRKRPLITNRLEVAFFVLRICLYAQGHREHELADAGAEARKESVEWLVMTVSERVGANVG